MIERLKELSFYIVIAVFITGLSTWAESDSFIKYLSDNLITLLVALLAINTTTSSVVMTKLKEISDAQGGSFSNTIAQLKLSVYEQIFYIIFAVMLLILGGSKVVLSFHMYIGFILNVLLTTVYVAAMYTLFDTAKSIFVILNHENKK